MPPCLKIYKNLKNTKQNKINSSIKSKKRKEIHMKLFFSFTFLPTDHKNTSKTKSSLIHFLSFSSTFLIIKHWNPSGYQIPQEQLSTITNHPHPLKPSHTATTKPKWTHARNLKSIQPIRSNKTRST